MEDQDLFERFTERARNVIDLAQEEARRFQHNYVGTEHLLLGLVREGQGIGAKVLEGAGVELDKVRAAVEFIIGYGDHPVEGEIKLTPRSKRVIQLAIDEASRLNHHFVGTEHLLLGLLHEGQGIAAGVLMSLGVDLASVRSMTLQILRATQESRAAAAENQEQEQAADDAPQQSASAQAQSGASERSSAPMNRDRFDKFTERARKALSLAQEEARRYQHNYIGTEHLLLGLVREGDGVAAQVLRNLGVELHTVRRSVEFIIGRGDRIVLAEIGLTPRAKRVIELAVDEARNMNHHYIGTEHLLLGLVREGEGIAAGVLARLGVKLDAVRAETLKVLGSKDEGKTGE